MNQALSKVPELILVFWIIKILATTSGETGGDAVSMSMDLGYLGSTGIFAVLFIAAVVAQIAAPKFYPVIYRLTIVASTTVGTTLADFATRSLGIGYMPAGRHCSCCSCSDRFSCGGRSPVRWPSTAFARRSPNPSTG